MRRLSSLIFCFVAIAGSLLFGACIKEIVTLKKTYTLYPYRGAKLEIIIQNDGSSDNDATTTKVSLQFTDTTSCTESLTTKLTFNGMLLAQKTGKEWIVAIDPEFFSPVGRDSIGFEFAREGHSWRYDTDITQQINRDVKMSLRPSFPVTHNMVPVANSAIAELGTDSILSRYAYINKDIISINFDFADTTSVFSIQGGDQLDLHIAWDEASDVQDVRLMIDDHQIATIENPGWNRRLYLNDMSQSARLHIDYLRAGQAKSVDIPFLRAF